MPRNEPGVTQFFNNFLPFVNKLTDMKLADKKRQQTLYRQERLKVQDKIDKAKPEEIAGLRNRASQFGLNDVYNVRLNTLSDSRKRFIAASRTAPPEVEPDPKEVTQALVQLPKPLGPNTVDPVNPPIKPGEADAALGGIMQGFRKQFQGDQQQPQGQPGGQQQPATPAPQDHPMSNAEKRIRGIPGGFEGGQESGQQPPAFDENFAQQLITAGFSPHEAIDSARFDTPAQGQPVGQQQPQVGQQQPQVPQNGAQPPPQSVTEVIDRMTASIMNPPSGQPGTTDPQEARQFAVEIIKENQEALRAQGFSEEEIRESTTPRVREQELAPEEDLSEPAPIAAFLEQKIPGTQATSALQKQLAGVDVERPQTKISLKFGDSTITKDLTGKKTPLARFNALKQIFTENTRGLGGTFESGTFFRFLQDNGVAVGEVGQKFFSRQFENLVNRRAFKKRADFTKTKQKFDNQQLLRDATAEIAEEQFGGAVPSDKLRDKFFAEVPESKTALTSDSGILAAAEAGAPGFDVANFTPEEAAGVNKVLRENKKVRLSIESPLQKATKGKIEDAILKRSVPLNLLTKAQVGFRPEYLQFGIGPKVAALRLLDKSPFSDVGGVLVGTPFESLSPQQRKAFLANYSSWVADVASSNNSIISALAGANVPPSEFDRIIKGLPNMDGDSPTEFITKLSSSLKDMQNLQKRDVLLLQPGMTSKMRDEIIKTSLNSDFWSLIPDGQITMTPTMAAQIAGGGDGGVAPEGLNQLMDNLGLDE